MRAPGRGRVERDGDRRKVVLDGQVGESRDEGRSAALPLLACHRVASAPVVVLIGEAVARAPRRARKVQCVVTS